MSNLTEAKELYDALKEALEAGKSSISAQYTDGTDKDTLVRAQKYLVTINYKN